MRFYGKSRNLVVQVPVATLEPVLTAVRRREFKDLETTLKAMGPTVYQAFENFSEGEIQEALYEALGKASPLAVLEGVIYPDEASRARIEEKAKKQLEEEKKRLEEEKDKADAPFVARAVEQMRNAPAAAAAPAATGLVDKDGKPVPPAIVIASKPQIQ